MFKFKKTLLLALFISFAVTVGTMIPSVESIAAETCYDNNNDGYCDTCGKVMNKDVTVDTKSASYTHTHTGNSTNGGGCYSVAKTDNWKWASGHSSGASWITCTSSHSYISSYSLSCGKDESSYYCGKNAHTHSDNCYPDHNFVNQDHTAGGSASVCSRCGTTYTTAGKCTRNGYNCGKTAHSHSSSCKHTHSGSSSSGGGCYGTANWSNGSHTSSCPKHTCTIGQGGCGNYYTTYLLGCDFKTGSQTYNYGSFYLVKNGMNLRVTSSLNNCSITAYSWKYGGTVIGSGSSITMTSLGTYTCTVTWQGTWSSGTVTLTYGANLSSLNISTNNLFSTSTSLSSTGYTLQSVINPDYASYFSVVKYVWSGAKNNQSWDKLPAPTSSGSNSSIFTQNCGNYSCTVTIKGKDGSQYTMTTNYNLVDFDAQAAANIIKANSGYQDSFTYAWDCFSLQNKYGQAERVKITNAYGGKNIATTNLAVFDTNHNLKSTENAEATVKTYSGVSNSVSEVVKYKATYSLSNYVVGTCTKKGTSTIASSITMDVYFKNNATGALYYSYSKSFSPSITEDVGRNSTNHDCEIKSATWKDTDYDGINDRLLVIRNCPAANGNWQIMLELNNPRDLFTVSQTTTNSGTADLCGTVKTVVTYEYITGKKVTYTTTDTRKHSYAHTYTSATCLNAGHYDYSCSRCGHKYSENFGSALGHSYVWTTTKQMTLSEDGESTGVCTRCGDTVIKVISSPHITTPTTPTPWTPSPFNPVIIEKPIEERDPVDPLHPYWELFGLEDPSGGNDDDGNGYNGGTGGYNGGEGSDPWHWDSDIGEYVWDGDVDPWEYNGGTWPYSGGGYTWNSDIGEYIWSGDHEPWVWDGDINTWIWDGDGSPNDPFASEIVIGSSAVPRFNSLINSGGGGGIGFNSGLTLSGIPEQPELNVDPSIYKTTDDEKRSIGEILKDIIDALLGILNNLINYFKGHPVIAVLSILGIIILIVGLVMYILARRDRKKFRENDEDEKTDVV